MGVGANEHRAAAVARAQGQTGFLPAEDFRTLRVVCGSGFYARRNETCRVCPLGAVCHGFMSGLGRNMPLGVIHTSDRTDIPRGQGNVDNDGLGLHTYPVPLAGFYNLNGTEAEPCPDMRREPGRDVCVVACVPPEACLGDNVCAPPYTSKAPNFRCAACNRGYFRR
jgi:hypothetical protein